MNYSVDELFRFEKTEGGYALAEYIQKDNTEITEIEIPARFNGQPVVRIGKRAFENDIDIKRVVISDTVTSIGDYAFSYATRLQSVKMPDVVTEIGEQAFDSCFSLTDIDIPKSIVRIGDNAFSTTRITSAALPKSLEVLGNGAFSCCFDLESVTFDCVPSFGKGVFYGCKKLPADVTLMGLVNSFDITQPLDADAYNTAFKINWSVENQYEHNIYTRPDVFKLAIKNDCFRSVDVSVLLRFLIEAGFTERLIYAEKHGMLDGSAALLYDLTEYSVRQNKPEITAFLLECKRRKFGYAPEDHYEL